MICRRMVALFFVAASVTLSSASEKCFKCTINFTVNPEVSREGESMMAVCDVKNPGNVSFFVVWEKKSVEDNQLIEISTNNHVNENFRTTGRYNASYKLATPNDVSSVKFMLIISDLRSEDSGLLTCKLGSEKADRFVPFTVQVPVHKIWWSSSGEQTIYADGQTVLLKESDPQQFACHVNGSYPKAAVQVFLGEKDITDLFRRTDSLKKGEGAKGLQSLHYRTDLVNNSSTIIGYHNMTEALKCVARLTGDSHEAPKVAQIEVNLTEYSPQFLCKEKMQAKLHEKYFNLTCKVHANPGVNNVTFHWISDDDDNDTLKPGETRNDVSADKTNGETKGEVVMVLTIFRVSTKHFQRKYIFEAENDVKLVRHVIQLEQDVTPEFNEFKPQSGATSCLMQLSTAVVMAFASALFFLDQ